MVTYAQLINANGTIYNSQTGRGYATPQELAADLGVAPHQIQWGSIKSGPAPTQPRTYENLVNQGGTIVNTQTGQAYSTPQQLARDLNIQPTQIQWQNIPTQQASMGVSDLEKRRQILQIHSAGDMFLDMGQASFNGKTYNISTPELLAQFLHDKYIAAGNEERAYQQRYAPQVNTVLQSTQSQNQQVQQQTEQLTQTTGDPKYDQLLGQLEGYLGELQKRGQVLNPNIELSPEQIAEFTKKAEGEINPFYQGQLKLARETLLRSQGFATDDILRTEQDLERKYGRQVRTLGESSADIGFAQSGLRQRDERELAEETQRTLEGNRRQLGFQAGTQALEFGQKYGAQELPQVNLQEAPRVLAGEAAFQRTGRTLPFYSVSPSILEGIVGSEEYNRRAAIRGRTSELESAQRTLGGIEAQRKLTL